MALDQLHTVIDEPIDRWTDTRPSPLPPDTRLVATCRLVGVDRHGDGAAVHLVTLGTGRLGDRALAGGTPVTLRAASPDAADEVTPGGAVVAQWAATGQRLDLDVRHTSDGLAYHLTDGRAVLARA
jgi:hypothetical protein